jgi:hypothetical protein
MGVSKIDTPREYFENVVVPDVEDFLRDPTNLRYAYHTCVSLLSLRDWVVKAYHDRTWSWESKPQGTITTTRQLQQALNLIDDSFEIITDIANASKHMILDPTRRQTTLYGLDTVSPMSR